MDILSSQTDWILSQGDPWVRHRTLCDLLDLPSDDEEVLAAREAMLGDPRVQGLIARAGDWPERPLKRHNDAAHSIYLFSTLADFGVWADDPGMAAAIEAVMAHQSPEGSFETLTNIPERFGGTGQDMWTWMLCDAPTLLYALLTMGLAEDERVQRAVAHLVELVDENGWRCVVAPQLGRFRGPGRKSDPCPVVNVFALKALAQVPELIDSRATHAGAEMLLWHWEHQAERKIYMFGIGTDYRKLKYPFVWYNVLHVVEVLSRFAFVHTDPRFREMVAAITAQADEKGYYKASSMYRAWKGWEFADKRSPSPWITFLVMRILKRLGEE